MSLSHEAIMAQVCTLCQHTMRDHAWTNDGQTYCLDTTCRCPDFCYETDYEKFRTEMMQRSIQEPQKIIPEWKQKRDTCPHTFPDGKSAWQDMFFGHMCDICGENDL
jgi:hypothetical protein